MRTVLLMKIILVRTIKKGEQKKKVKKEMVHLVV
jgi:hypothetical protein